MEMMSLVLFALSILGVGLGVVAHMNRQVVRAVRERHSVKRWHRWP